MKLPKKFQNEYKQATMDGNITFFVGETVRAAGAKGTILKVSAGSAFVQFSGYEIEIPWTDVRKMSAVERKQIKREPKRNATQSHALTTAKQVAQRKTTDAGASDFSELDCERRIAVKEEECERLTRHKDDEIRNLRRANEDLRETTERLARECAEEKGSGSLITPEGSIVPAKQPVWIGIKAKEKREILAGESAALLVAPKELKFNDIDFARNVELVLPATRSVQWGSEKAFEAGFTSLSYSLYHYVPSGKRADEFDIDANLGRSSKQQTTPPTDISTISESASCKVELATVKGRETVRVIFTNAKSGDDLRVAIVELKKHGFRYYHEKSTDLKYWGSFFSTEKYNWAKNFCGESPSTKEEYHTPPTVTEFEEPRHDVEIEHESPDNTTPVEENADAEESRKLDAAEQSMKSIEALLAGALKR